MKKGNNEAARYYDKISRRYDSSHTRGYFEFLNKFELSAMPKNSAKKSALEVGCGSGIVLERVAGISGNAVGIDISAEMLRKAAARKLAVCRADAAAIPFKPESFALVYSFKTLPHVREIGAALEEMSRVCEKGGFVLLEFYNKYSAKRLVKAVFPTKVFTRYYSPGEMKSLVPDSLEISEVKGAMVAAPSSVLFSVPFIGSAIASAELLLSKTFLKKFGSHILLVCRKK